MSIFIPGQHSSLDDILSSPPVLRFLYVLQTEAIFFAASHVHAFFRTAKPAGVRMGDFKKRIRVIMDVLEDARYLGKSRVDRLPPVTSQEEPFHTWAPAEPPLADTKAFSLADAAACRVPPLDAHAEADLYFARGRLVDVLWRAGYRLHTGTLTPDLTSGLPPAAFNDVDPSDLWRRAREIEAAAAANKTTPVAGPVVLRWHNSDLPYTYQPWPGREHVFHKMLEWHKAVESRVAPSAHELAGTYLTAQHNLNQLRFSPKFAAVTEYGEGEFAACSKTLAGWPDASVDHRDLRCHLFFLRPYEAAQIRHQMDEFMKLADRFLFQSCWWV